MSDSGKLYPFEIFQKHLQQRRNNPISRRIEMGKYSKELNNIMDQLRGEIAPLMGELTESALKDVRQDLQTNLERIRDGMQQLFSILRQAGMEMETIVYVIEQSAPGFRERVNLELLRTHKLVTFLDSINIGGEHSEKPFKEKLDMVRDWNKVEENLKVEHGHFGLVPYLMNNPTEFSYEEMVGLAVEFKFEKPPFWQNEVAKHSN